MENPFRIKKSYRIRHKILKVLHEDWENNEETMGRMVGSIKIAKATKIPIAEIHSFQYLLLESNDISFSDHDGQSMISIQQGGLAAFIDKKYIREGRRHFWDEYFAWARIVIPLGALIIAVVTYLHSRKLENKIKIIETELREFKK